MSFLEVLALLVAWQLFGSALVILLLRVPRVRNFIVGVLEPQIPSPRDWNREVREEMAEQDRIEEQERELSRRRGALINDTLWSVMLPDGSTIICSGIVNVKDGVLVFARYGFGGFWNMASVYRWFAPGAWRQCWIVRDPLSDDEEGPDQQRALFDDPPHTDPAKWPGGT